MTKSTKKLKIGVLFGGKSTEHEASLQTAKTVIEGLDKTKYEVIPIGINKKGTWLLAEGSEYLLHSNNPKLIKLNKSSKEVTLTQGSQEIANLGQARGGRKKIDLIYPVLHGPLGEDGTVQGLLKLAGIPFVGASVLGSAVGMDKDIMKRLLREASIPIGKFISITSEKEITFEKAKKNLGMPLFIKPANAGSSVGVSKVKNKKEFRSAIREAFKYDTKIMIEEAIVGREIECGVLGNSNPVASVPGEIIPKHAFYTYEAKYIDEEGATYEIPANLSKQTAKKIRNLAIATYKTLNCEGMGRIDFFLKKNGEVLVNEINTIPGPVMFRRLWEASGIPFKKVLDILINLSLERFKKEKKLQTSVK